MARLDWRLAPAATIVVGLFATGLLAAFVESVGVVDGGWPTPRHYGDVLGDREFRASLGLTFWVATTATLTSVALGVGLALVLQGLARGRGPTYALLQVPLAVPHLAMAVGMLTLLSPSGWVSRLFFTAGLVGVPADFPVLVHDRYGLGIILAYVVKETPFLALVATALLVRIDGDYGAVARTLGASPWQRFRHVTWPLLAPGVGAAALMVFAFVFTAFETPFLLGRPFPSLLSVVAHRRFMSIELADRPAALAMALLMTAMAGGLVWASLRLAGAGADRDRPVIF